MPRLLLPLVLSVLAASAAAGYDLSSIAGTARPVVATDGVDYLAAWVEQSSTDVASVVAARFTGAGAIGERLRLGQTSDLSASAAVFDLSSSAAGPHPVVATDGAGYLAAWVESTSPTDFAVFAAPFTSTAGPLAAPIRLGPTGSGGKVAIAYGGGVYLVAWDSNAGVTGALVTPAGVMTQLFIIGEGSSPALAWNGSGFFAVWKGASSPGAFRIFGASVAVSGAVGTARQVSPEPPSIQSLPNGMYFLDPQVAWDGRQYVVAWRTAMVITSCITLCLPPTPFCADVARVSADGVPLDAAPSTLIGYGQQTDVNGIHLAASGESTAVALDISVGIPAFLPQLTGVDLIVLRSDFTPSRRTFLQWYPFYLGASPWSPALSDITFDGTSFVVVCRLRDGVRSWLTSSSLSANGDDVPSSRRVAAVADRNSFLDPAPSAAGGVALIGEGSGVRAYTLSQIPAGAAAPPLPPRDVVATGGGSEAQVKWSGGDGSDGFIVERDEYQGIDWVPVAVVRDGAARMANVTLPFPDASRALRVRAYNSAGVSQPSPSVMPEQPRRRTARH